MFKKIHFKNGLRLVTIPLRNTRSTVILVLVRAGTKYETKEKNGISHFLEHMCFKGTEKRPCPFDISKEVDRVGGIFNAFTSKDYTGYFVKLDFSHFNLGVDIVSDIFLHSIFKEEEIEKERGVILEEMKMLEDTPTHYIEDLFEKLLYGDQPAGWNIVGTKKAVLSIKREDLIKYTKEHYVAKNVVVTVAGRIQPHKATSLIERYFSDVRKGESKKKKRVKEKQIKPNTLFCKKDTEQTHLALGVRTFNMFHKARYILSVMATLLGGNMSSRLFQEIREKRGLAYYISTHSEVNPDTGYLVSYAGVDHKKINDVVSLILEEYKKIKEKDLSKKEVERAKEYLKGRLRLSLEESENVASFYGSQELLENRILTPEEKIKEIEKVTPGDIKEVGDEIFMKNKLNLAVISPYHRTFKHFSI